MTTFLEVLGVLALANVLARRVAALMGYASRR
jgi:hypothetical protein